MSEHLHWRRKAQASLEAYFERHSRPRAILTIVLGLTGLAGLLVSVGLYHLGVERMWIRYPLAVAAGYLAFLGLLRGWVEWEHAHFEPDELAGVLPPVPGAPPRLARGTGAHSGPRKPAKSPGPGDHLWGELGRGALEGVADEGCLFFFLIAAVIGVIVTLIAGILAAPALVAEVFLDAFLITVLYQRLRVKADEHWLRTAIRRTWAPTLLIAVLFSIAGGSLAQMAPGTTSLGEAIHYLLEFRHAPR